tara:strand:- start:15595 stop:17142 length:1548 start_codon:yes stop_codon:yes gene_type:complete
MNNLWYTRDIEPKFRQLEFFSLKTRSNPIYLQQTDFDKGTYRITKPGLYILSESIVFHPNPHNDFKPTIEQFNDNVYSPNPYRLGFFAAITIECSNVVLDLNGFQISQSTLHNLKQRFFALIETANTPFIPKTGPSNFGNDINAAHSTIIKNGCLDLSSHHGIHGNNNDGLLIHDIIFKNFEVAAISLNGGKHIFIKDCQIKSINTNISSLHTLSQCLFAAPFLNTIQEKYPDAYLQTNNGKKTIQYIKDKVETETALFINSHTSDNSIQYDGIFKNVSGLLDGNAYGIVLNSTGPVVGAFKDYSPSNTRNNYIVIENTTIENIISDGGEVLGYGLNDEIKDGSYGKNQLIGPVGDIIQFENVLNEDGFYIGNTLTDMQLIINKYGTSSQEKGRGNVPSTMIQAIEENLQSVRDIKKEHGYYCISGRDSMGHHMKGTTGIFISQGQHVVLKENTINNISNNGLGNTASSESSGILLSGTNHITMMNNTIDNISSKKENNAVNIRYKLQNNNISIL